MTFLRNTDSGIFLKITHGPEAGKLFQYDDFTTAQEDFESYNANNPFTPTDQQKTAAWGQGLTFGFADEMKAFFGAAADKAFLGADFKDNYESLRNAYRDEIESYKQSDPLGYMGREIGGSLPTAFGLASKLAKIPSIQAALQGGWKSKEAIKAASKIGAVEGSLYGTGVAGGAPISTFDTETDQPLIAQDVKSTPLGQTKTIAGSGIGGAIGGPIGQSLAGAIPMAGRYAADKTGGLLARFNNFLSNNNKIAVEPVVADKMIADVLLANDVTEDQVVRWLSANPAATLADFNRSMQKMGENVAARLKMPDDKLEYFQLRDVGALDRILLPIRKHFGGVVESNRTISQLKAARESQAKPLYTAAFEEGIENTPILEEAFKLLKKTKPDVIAKSKRLGLIDAFNNDIPLDEKALGEAVPTLRWWQAITQQLDDEIGELIRKGAGQEVSKLVGFRKKIVNELFKQNDNYRAANEIWANSKHYDNLLDAGRELFKENKLSEVFFNEEYIKNLSQKEKQTLMLGFGEALENKMSQMVGTADFGVMAGSMKARPFLTKVMEEKLRMLLPKEAFNEFAKMIKLEAQFKGTANQIDRGSQTFSRTIVDEKMDEMATQSTKPLTTSMIEKLMQNRGVTDDVVVDLQNRLFTPAGPNLLNAPVGQPFNQTGITTPSVLPVSPFQFFSGSGGGITGGINPLQPQE